MDNSKRFFIAIFPPENVLNYFRDFNRLLKKEERNFIFVPKDQIHFRTQYLGANIKDEDLYKINQVLSKKNFSSPKIELENLKFGFPSQISTFLVFQELKKTAELKAFTTNIHNAVKELNIKNVKKQKDYSKLIFHITIARSKRRLSNKYKLQINNLLDTAYNKLNKPESFYANQISIVTSEIKRTKRIYKRISDIKLKNPLLVE